MIHSSFTSYFVGIELESQQFLSLFVTLQKYILHHNISSIITLTNPLSLHITLCYFGLRVDNITLKNIKHQINNITFDEKIHIKGFDYFGGEGKEKVGYLSIKHKSIFSNMNQLFMMKYQVSDILDNIYDFIPHITLFKIHESDKFQFHKQNICKIIHNTLIGFLYCTHNGLELYGVSSTYIPEIQLKL